MPSTNDPTRIDHGGSTLECSLVPWDTEIFGFPVAQVDRVELAGDAGADEVMARFDAWCADRDVRLVSCRLDHARLRESMALEGLGFRFVEMVYSPRISDLGSVAAPQHAIEVGEPVPGDLEAIEEIAYAVFSTGRFLLDWRLPGELSRRRYATWVRNSLDSSEQTVLKAESGGELIGFFIVEPRPDRSVYWHLTAIAPGWHGKGMGKSLWQTMLIRHRTEGATAVATTISGHNAPAMNLHARLGFTFESAQMTFHWLRDTDR